ncbi:MAG: hypothetical protein ACXADY_00375 [Candidatus Hodarchaeales archaeon]|jgi:hypothetical protein
MSKKDVIWDSSSGDRRKSPDRDIEKMMKIRFKDPQLPPDQNIREKYVNINGTVFQAITAARDAFNIPEVVPIALLFKGRRMNPSNNLSSYEIEPNAILMIVPDQIKGG